MLRDELANKLREILKDFRLKKPKSDGVNDYDLEGIQVFEQNIPRPKMHGDFSYCPVVVVQEKGGKVTPDEQNSEIILLIQTWDDSDQQTGEDDVIDIINCIINHFIEYPRLNLTYWCKRDITWAVDNEQNPYFDGNISMTWEIPKADFKQGVDSSV